MLPCSSSVTGADTLISYQSASPPCKQLQQQGRWDEVIQVNKGRLRRTLTGRVLRWWGRWTPRAPTVRFRHCAQTHQRRAR